MNVYKLKEYIDGFINNGCKGEVYINAKERMFDYSICIYDKTISYRKDAIIDVGNKIVLDIFGGKNYIADICKTKVLDDLSIEITFKVPESLYDDFINQGQNDFYDIHLDYVKINNRISYEWEW